MKPFRNPAPAAVCLLALLFLASCGDDPQDPAPDPGPTGRLVEATGCKSLIDNQGLIPGPNSWGSLFWSYDAETGRLGLKHENAGLNCCSEYTASVTLVGDLIIVAEVETEGLCDCLCLYDFAFEVTNLPVGVYEITVVEEYLQPGDEILAGTIDLTQAESGIFLAERSSYPWGL